MTIKLGPAQTLRVIRLG